MKFCWTTNPFTNMSTKRSRTNSRLQLVDETPIIEEGENTKNEPLVGENKTEELPLEQQSNDTLEDLMRQSISIALEDKEKKKKEKKALKDKFERKIIKRFRYTFVDDYPNLQATDILDYYNLINEEAYEQNAPQRQQDNQEKRKKDFAEKGSSFNSSFASISSFASLAGPVQYATVTWFGIEIKPGVPYPQLILLKESLQRFFELFPLEYRSAQYNEVKTEICVIGNNQASTKDLKQNPERKKSAVSLVEMLLNSFKKAPTASSAEELVGNDSDPEEVDEYLHKPKILLVSLLYEKEDLFQKLEEYLIMNLDLYLSRCIHNCTIECNFMQSWQDIYENSLHYYSLENKLFGPQESELIDKDLINPLKYAKEIRNLKKSYESILEKLSNPNEQEVRNIFSIQELAKICKENGYYDQSFNYHEVLNRVRDIYNLKLELLNYGELNAYSKDVLSQIFYKYHINPENAKYAREIDYHMKLWEFNEFLYATDIQTLYNKKEYENFMVSNQLYMDSEKQLSLESFYSYYERIGNLMSDVLAWKICNLDSFLTGVVNINFVYDQNALNSIVTSYYEKKPMFMNPFMKEVMKLMMIKDYTVEKNVNTVSEILEQLFVIEKLVPSEEATAASSQPAPQRPATSSHSPNSKDFKEKLLKIFSLPGEFANILNSAMMIWNNGREGVLPLLRKYMYEEFINDNDLLIHRHYRPLDKSAEYLDLFPPPTPSTVSSPPHSKKSSRSPSKKNLSPSKKTSSNNSFTLEEEEPPKITLLDTITFDPSKLEVPKDKKDLNNEEHDNNVYYDTEDEERLANQEIKERIIFDELFQNYYLKEYEVLLRKALKEEEIRVRLAEERKREVEETVKQAEEIKAKEAQEKKKMEDAGIIGDNAEDGFLDALLTEKIPEVYYRSEEEIEDEVCTLLARSFLNLKPKSFDSAIQTLQVRSSSGSFDEGSVSTPKSKDSSFEEEIKKDPKEMNKNWKKLKNQIIDDLVFLYQVRSMPGVNIDLEESQEIENRKSYLLKQLQFIAQYEVEHQHEFTKSFLMMYDCLRLFSTDLAHIGIGTKDFCIRYYMNNLFTNNQSNQLLTFLPKGLNELSPVNEYEKNKLHRYINRKMKALAAIEREKMRRNLTEEEKEKLKQEKLLKMKEEFIVEERNLFHQALGELLEIREIAIKDKEEVLRIVKLFEEIVTLKDSRFPDEFQSQIARNNLACVQYELYGLEHPLCESAPYFLEEACEHIVKLGFDEPVPNKDGNENSAAAAVNRTMTNDSYATSIPSTILNMAPIQSPSRKQSVESNHNQPSDDNSTIFTNENDGSLQNSVDGVKNSSQANQQAAERIAHPLNKAIIIVNYLHVLQLTESFTKLKQAVNIKQFLVRCYRQLTNSEKHKLKNAIIPEVETISVFHLNDLINPKKQINHIIPIIEMCEKEYEYHEKQYAALSGSAKRDLSYSFDSASIGTYPDGGQIETIPEGDQIAGEEEGSVLSDLHSVTSHKKHSKKLSRSKTSNSLSSGQNNDASEVDDEDASIQSESKKRKLERELKKQKSMEQRKRDAAMRQEISKQRNKLYTLIQTNQISDIFDRKANKFNKMEEGKWKVPTYSTKAKNPDNEDKSDEELEEEEEEEFLELAKGMASHKIIS